MRRYRAHQVDETPLLLELAIEADAARVAERRTGNVIWRDEGTLLVQFCDLIDARVQLELPASRQGS